tara:strand:+ start:1183 stop:1959 length:777 start_codon:yes stop_codon:yes gene_type:complete
MQEPNNRPDYISISQVNRFQMCGLQYYFRYIEGIKTLPNDNMLRGSAIDSSANEHFNEKSRNEVGISENNFIDLAVATHDEKSDDTEFVENTKDESRDKTAVSSKKYHSVHGQTIKPKLNENGDMPTQIKILEDIGDNVTLMGFVDLVTEDDTIVDTKVRKADKGIDVEANLQLQTYATILDADKVGIASVTTAKDPKATYYGGVSNKTTKERAIQRIKSVSAAIDSNVFLPAPEGSWVCSEKYCGYWNMCDFGAKRK